MYPVSFEEQNTEYARGQSEYLNLPAHMTSDGIVTSCWSMGWRERIRVLFGANIYWSQMTFNRPLQPIKPSLDRPIPE